MASGTLYPPIVRDSEPAFIAGDGAELKVYFNLSSLGDVLPVGWNIQASIITTDGNLVVNTQDSDVTESRLRATGTILNIPPQSEGKIGYYSITLKNEDLKTTATIGSTNYGGWIPGQKYKIQLRISTVECGNNDRDNQAAWLQRNSNNFTEWSTICYVKAIAAMNNNNLSGLKTIEEESGFQNAYVTNFKGTISCSLPEVEEDYYSCRILLYQCNEQGQQGELLEDSGTLFNNEISNSNYDYLFKNRFIINNNYKIIFTFITENDYQSDNYVYQFKYKENDGSDETKYRVTAIDGDAGTWLSGITTVSQEEDEGRIALKLYYDDNGQGEDIENVGFYIRRASSIDNFTTWDDIRYIGLPDGAKATINNSDIFYDYTIESGIWYVYALQPIDLSTGLRKKTQYPRVNDDPDPKKRFYLNPSLRNFSFNFLLGYGEQQLKLEFDNIVNNYNIRVADSSLEGLGSKYPFINRNNKIYYHTFGIAGLISFNMDEQNTFLKDGKKSIYKYDNIVDLYNNYNINHGITIYDYIYEREFRKQVENFLYQDRPMLYKSPTEGNILVRLSDISFTPNQALSRLVYSFSANAKEIDDNNLYNYKKYGLYYPDILLETNFEHGINNHHHSLNDDTPTFLPKENS